MRKVAHELLQKTGAVYLTAFALMRYLVLLAPFLAAFIALTMRSRTQSLVVLFVYLSIEGFLKLATGYHPVVHVGIDIAVWLVVAVWVASALARRESRLPRVPFLAVLVLHAMWVGLLVFSPYTASLVIGIASWKVHLTMIPLYFIGYLAAEDEHAPSTFFRGLTVFWCFAFLLTVLQYAGGPGGPFDLGGVYLDRLVGYHEWRPFGTTAVPGGESVFAMVALPFALALVLREDYRLTDPWVVFCVVGSLVVFFISGVRQVFLACIIVVSTMVGLQLVRRRGRAALVFLAAVIAGAGAWVVVQEYVLPAAEEAIADADVPEIWRRRNAVERFEELLDPALYRTAREGGLQLIVDRVRAFPFGAGLGRTGAAAARFEDELAASPLGMVIQERFGFADNYFAAMLVETGVPGTLLLTSLVVALLVLAVRLARGATSQRDSVLGALVAGYLVALMITSWGSQPLLANPTQAFFWVLSGMMARRYHIMAVEAAPGVDVPTPETASAPL